MLGFLNKGEAAPASNWTTPTNEEQKKLPLMEGIAMVVGVFLWLGSYLGMVGVLVPARIAEIDPDAKATALAAMSAIAMVVSTIANILEGAWSDRTRSRFGRRTPWLYFGSIGAAISIYFWGTADSITAIIAWDAIFMIFLNAIVAPLIAVLSDRVAPRHRGTISSMYAIGLSVGNYGGQILASFFIGVNEYYGVLLMALMALLSGPLSSVFLREKSTIGMPVEKLTLKNLSDNFAFPLKDCRDYYLALIGKLCVVSAQFTVSGYQLYILTDYIKLSNEESAGYIGIISTILMVMSIVLSLFSGPIADKFHWRKWPVVIASLLMSVGCIIPSFAPEAWLMLVYAAVAGVGYGIFSSLDQALNIDVLPNEKTAAKDLGILNIANNGGQVVGPVLSGIIIATLGYGYVFHLGCALALIGAILLAMIKKVK